MSSAAVSIPTGVYILAAAGISAGTAIAVAVGSWFVDRLNRTYAELSSLCDDAAVRRLRTPEPDRRETLRDAGAMATYYREVLRPVTDRLELLAAMLNGRWPTPLSMRIVRRLAGRLIVAIWDDFYIQHAVRHMRSRTPKGRPCHEFERLVVRLRAKLP